MLTATCYKRGCGIQKMETLPPREDSLGMLWTARDLLAEGGEPGEEVARHYFRVLPHEPAGRPPSIASPSLQTLKTCAMRCRTAVLGGIWRVKGDAHSYF